jgi:hypothetical protein
VTRQCKVMHGAGVKQVTCGCMHERNGRSVLGMLADQMGSREHKPILIDNIILMLLQYHMSSTHTTTEIK